MSDRELRPCPFCGNPDVGIRCYLKDGKALFSNRYAVLCDYDSGGCGAESGHYKSVREAAAAWNQRRRKWRAE